ncbi:MAG: PAS domain S-box protein [Chloroflexi bacterium]|nr:PAS domain S-box protein [Chloroflexota bacterium]
MRTRDERKLKTILGSVSADISGVKQLQEELLKSEEKYRTILEEMGEGYYEIDCKGHFIFINEAIARIFGGTRHEMLEMSYKQYIPQENWSSTVADYANVYKTGIPKRRRPGISLKKDGTITYREDSIFPLRNEKGEIIGVRGIARDVTEQKLAEDALIKEKLYSDAVIDSLPGIFYVIDTEGRFVRYNKNAMDVVGYSAEEAQNMRAWDIIAEEDKELMAAKLIEVFRDGAADTEIKIVTKAGKKIPYHITAKRVVLGDHTYMLGTGVDISKRLAAERARDESEKHYKLLAENTTDVVLMLDTNLNITWISAPKSQDSGFTLEELQNLPVEKQLTPESLKKTTDIFIAAYEDEMAGRGIPDRHYDVELEVYRKDGSTYWTENRFQCIRDEQGKATGMLMQGRDITDRKRAERARDESEKNYRLLAENTTDIVTIMDKDNNLVWVSASGEKLTGFSFEEQRNMPLTKKVAPESAKRSLELFTRMMREEKEGTFPPDRHYDIQSELYCKDGSTIWTDTQMRFIRDDQGEAIAVLMQIRDITERKKAEDALQKTMADLKRSNEELQQFAYVASHDLQEPLRMVSSYVQLIEKRYKDKLDPDAHDFIDYAVSGAKRMQNLINDLLSYSRVGTRGKPFMPVDCSEVLYAATSNLEVAIREAGAVIEHEDLPEVIGDEGQLVQVFQNVIGNAIKFHGAEPPHICIGAKLVGDEWVFSVKDNGIGIDPQFFERIFLVFQRLNGAEYPGTGIGLSIARKVVQRHGGRMWLESQPGQGSTFYFTVPVREKGDTE